MMRKLLWTTLFTGLVSLTIGCSHKAPEYPIGSTMGGSGDLLGVQMIARDNPGVYVEASPQGKVPTNRSNVASVPND